MSAGWALLLVGLVLAIVGYVTLGLVLALVGVALVFLGR